MLVQYTYNFVHVSQFTCNVVTINSTIISLNAVIILIFKLIHVVVIYCQGKTEKATLISRE